MCWMKTDFSVSEHRLVGYTNKGGFVDFVTGIGNMPNVRLGGSPIPPFFQSDQTSAVAVAAGRLGHKAQPNFGAATRGTEQAGGSVAQWIAHWTSRACSNSKVVGWSRKLTRESLL